MTSAQCYSVTQLRPLSIFEFSHPRAVHESATRDRWTGYIAVRLSARLASVSGSADGAALFLEQLLQGGHSSVHHEGVGVKTNNRCHPRAITIPAVSLLSFSATFFTPGSFGYATRSF